jgi:serine/threonine protein kinase
VYEAAGLRDLESFLAAKKDLAPAQKLRLSLDVAEGTRALHNVGVIYCDIKPKNILIFKGDKFPYVLKLTDFGSLLLVSEVPEILSALPGTRIWQPPEARGRIPRNQLTKVDIFSLGLVIWSILTFGFPKDVLNALDQRVLGNGSLEEAMLSTTLRCVLLESLRELSLLHDRNGEDRDRGNGDEGETAAHLSRLQSAQYLLIQALHENSSEGLADTKDFVESLRKIVSPLIRNRWIESVIAGERPFEPFEFDELESEVFLSAGM